MATQLIEFERTPNPNALRVLPGTTLWDRGPPIELHAGEDAAGVPLAQELLEIEGVASVMIGGDFVTILRSSTAFDWSELRPQILAVIADFVLAGRSPVATAQFLRPADSEDQDMIVRQIEEVLERFVRPQLARDGGDATFVAFDAATGVAEIRMGGACGGCPSGLSTLKFGIEKTIKHYIPEVAKVVSNAETGSPTDPRARFREWVKAKWGSLQKRSLSSA